MPRQNTIQLRKGTLAQWTSNNTEILASGEPGFETDTLRLKIGNGTTAWSELNYVGLAGTGTSGYLPKFNSSQGVTNSLIFDNGTNVGIGIVAPSALFSVHGGITNNYTAVALSTNGVSTTTHVGVGNSDDRPFLASLNGNLSTSIYGWGFFDRGTDGFLNIQRKGGGTSWVSVMTMNRTNGNVGIGTGVQATTPPEKLTVDGNIRVADTAVTQGKVIQFSRGGGDQYDYTIGRYGAALAISVANDAQTHRPFQVGYHSGATFLPKFHINGYTGDVGMGTVTPSGKLHVVGNSYFTDKIYGGSGNAFIQFNVAGQNRIDIGSDSASSSAFIGTTELYLNSPQLYANTTLSFPKTATAVSTATQKDSHGIILYNSMWNGSAELQTDSTIRSIASTSVNTRSRLAFLTSNEDGTNNKVERLSILTNGDIGIGTTTPGYKLEVNGSFAASTKSFRINHPSKKDHSLEYGSLESPYHGVRLTGRGKVIKGVGTVSLPDYLKDLIHDDDTLNIQITNIKHGKTIYIDKIDLKNDRFIVKADRAKSLGELQFCWTLSGVRKDVDYLVVEKRN